MTNPHYYGNPNHSFMPQKTILDSHIKQLKETWEEYLATTNAKDQKTRLAEIRSYLRQITLALEPLENQASDSIAHGKARKMLRKYRPPND